jgi:Kef-type K+ transport system membrane component KefB
VILLGVAALTAGAADLLGLSPLFVAVVAGVAFANLSPRKESAYGLMASREQILYAVFLLIAGAMFGFERGRLLWLMVPGYALMRAAAKLCGGLLGRALFLPRAELSRGIGAGLLFQGGLPVVIAVHFEHAHGKMVALPLFMTIFILGVVINDMVARRVAVAVLKREGGR